ncbi:DUF1467 family protein [Paracoccus sulfuroxidans]|uniref:Putative secreted protein n=1 Tax=Paracoccus sulfuroxidans TaxID=384678 RepID=A0A562NSK0_9RHOB|nr:DUF1467 family protein [Paracoccus sulfuroxidans]TWI35103.1 putative secreted protein [Paracoccus sulfuroxidans]
MSLTGGFVLYATLWFLVLFVVVPIGQKSQADAGHVVPGTPAGAPHDLRFMRKCIITTVITTILFGIIAWVIFADIITRADLEKLIS